MKFLCAFSLRYSVGISVCHKGMSLIFEYRKAAASHFYFLVMVGNSADVRERD